RGSQPAVVHLYDADLPRTATQKVKRSEVKAILVRLASASEAPVPIDGRAVSGVRHAIAAIANRKAAEILPGMTLRGDLGFDSLMAMELTTALEAQAGRSLDTGRLAQCETVAEIEALVGEISPAEKLAPEKVEEEPIVLPPLVAETAKHWMGR